MVWGSCWEASALPGTFPTRPLLLGGAKFSLKDSDQEWYASLLV